MGGTPYFLLTCLVIELPMAWIGMMLQRDHPLAVAATIDVLLVYVVSPHLPEAAAAKAHGLLPRWTRTQDPRSRTSMPRG